MEVTRNWLEMEDEIMGQMILQRIDDLEILKSTQKVCTTWRRICKNPAMWKVIFINYPPDAGDTDSDVEKLIKQAVHRSCGELIDITLDFYGTTDHLLDFISQCSSKLNHLRLFNGHGVTGCGLTNALKSLPHLETLELSFISISAKDIEVIGRNCPRLKFFNMLTWVIDFDVFTHAIANSMPALRHLELAGGTTVNDDGIQAILNGCTHLQSLDLSGCAFIHLDSNLEKLCRERIKDFKCKRNNVLKVSSTLLSVAMGFNPFDRGGMGLPDDDDDDCYMDVYDGDDSDMDDY